VSGLGKRDFSEDIEQTMTRERATGPGPAPSGGVGAGIENVLVRALDVATAGGRLDLIDRILAELEARRK
jgi:hypothetical protein